MVFCVTLAAMTFVLPAARVLHTANSSSNRGLVGSPLTGQKTAGNLPITTNASQIQNNSTSDIAGAPDYIWFGLNTQSSTTSFDVSTDTRVVVWSVQYNAPNRIQTSNLANGGARFRVGSGSSSPPSDYKDYFIGGNDTPFCASQAGPVTMCIDLNETATVNSTGGTFDNTDVTARAFGCVRFNLQGSSTLLAFFQRMFLFETSKDASDIPKFTGTGADWDEAFTAVQGSDYTDKIGAWLTKSGNSFFVPCPFQFGDGGTTTTTFDDSGAIVVSPASNAAGAENFRLTDQAMRVYASLGASDDITLSGTYQWGTAAPWDFDESVGAITIEGAAFSGMGQFILGSAVTGAASFALASGEEVVINGASLKGSTFNNDVRLNTVTNLTNMVINGDLFLNVATDATIDFSNVTIAGDIVNVGAGNITINKFGGNTYTEGTHTGGTVTITENITLIINDLPSGVNVRIYDANSGGNLVDSETNITDGDYIGTIAASLGTVYVQVSGLDYDFDRFSVDVSSGNVTLSNPLATDLWYAA